MKNEWLTGSDLSGKQPVPSSTLVTKNKGESGVGIQLFSLYLGRKKEGRQPKIVLPAADSTSKLSYFGISNASASETLRLLFLPLKSSQASVRERVNHKFTTECQPDEN